MSSPGYTPVSKQGPLPPPACLAHFVRMRLVARAQAAQGVFVRRSSKIGVSRIRLGRPSGLGEKRHLLLKRPTKSGTPRKNWAWERSVLMQGDVFISKVLDLEP